MVCTYLNKLCLEYTKKSWISSWNVFLLITFIKVFLLIFLYIFFYLFVRPFGKIFLNGKINIKITFIKQCCQFILFHGKKSYFSAHLLQLNKTTHLLLFLLAPCDLFALVLSCNFTFWCYLLCNLIQITKKSNIIRPNVWCFEYKCRKPLKLK